MKTIEASGKTVEEALSSGLKQLGVDISEVTHEVLDKGSPGLFGMFGRLAKVRISVIEQPKEDDDFDIDLPTLSLAPEQKPAKQKDRKDKKDAKPAKAEKTDKAEKAEKPEKNDKADKKEAKTEAPAPKATSNEVKNEVAEKAEKNEKPEDGAPKPSRPRRERQPRKDKKAAKPAADETAEERTEDAQPAAISQPAREFPPLDVDALSEDAKKAYEFISGITRLMQVDVEIRMLEEEKQIFIDISGDTLGVLIGRRGDTLDAIQYLTSLNVNKDKDEYIRVTIDVEHYRAKREDTLRKLANRMASRARKSGRRVVLEPMNPYERRVLHSALQDNPYVQTHSEGEEPYRRVIITLK